MNSVCISSCVNDTRQVSGRVRATYVSLHRWPESDAEFVRSLSFRSSSSAGSDRHSHHHSHRHCRHYLAAPAVVDSISCRQMYLRSYSFTARKESVNERAKKCIGKVKEKVVNGRHRGRKETKERYWRKVKEVPCAAFKSLFRKLLFCAASVDVVDVEC